MTAYQVLDCDGRAAWLAARQQFIGASESAAIFGVGYADQSAYSVWAEKTGRLERSESESERLHVGLMMEPSLRDIATWKLQRPVKHIVNALWVSNVTPWLAASLDGFVDDDAGLIAPVELKNVGQFAAGEWADGEIPLKFAIQVQHQMAVTGARRAWLMGLIGGQRPEMRAVERNDAFIDAMIDRLADFWRHVETDTPPEVDGLAATAKALAKLHPQDNGLAVALRPELDGAEDELASIKARLKELEGQKDVIENQIKAEIGDATYGVFPRGSVFSWKTQDRKGYVVEPTTFRTLRSIKSLPKGVLVEMPLACGARLGETATATN